MFVFLFNRVSANIKVFCVRFILWNGFLPQKVRLLAGLNVPWFSAETGTTITY